MWPLLLGMVGAGLILAIGVKRELPAFARQAAALERSLTGRGATLEAYMASRANAIRDELESFGDQYAGQLATRTANNVMARQYGLTPDRLARIETLIQRLERLGVRV